MLRAKWIWSVVTAAGFVGYVLHAACVHSQVGGTLGPCAAMHLALRGHELSPHDSVGNPVGERDWLQVGTVAQTNDAAAVELVALARSESASWVERLEE